VTDGDAHTIARDASITDANQDVTNVAHRVIESHDNSTSSMVDQGTGPTYSTGKAIEVVRAIFG
jgi:hypothetical protein